MTNLMDLPLKEVMRYAEFGKSQMLGQMQAQMNYQGQMTGLFANPLAFLGGGFFNAPQQHNAPNPWGGPKVRRITDAQLEVRYKRFVIDLEAERRG